jgi:hypothetical protein
MGKRSSFERIPRDFYPTPLQALIPLLDHLPERCRFIEPCAGDGRLVDMLQAAGHICACRYDIEPRREDITKLDALTTQVVNDADFIITNPPWDRSILHPMIEHFSSWKPTWLLFDADWMHTRQAAPFMPWLKAVVSVGRVKWIPDSPFTGKDNCCWYLFNQSPDAALAFPALFYGRAA